MSTRGLSNILAIVCLCIAVYIVTAGLRKSAIAPAEETAETSGQRTVTVEHTADGTPAIRDTRGALVPIRPYERIVAGSITTTEVARELIEPDRVVAYTNYASPGGEWKYSGTKRIEHIGDIETLLSLNPDIVFYNGPIAAEPIARLNEHGVETFDLGAVRGLDSYLNEAQTILTVIGNPERFDAYRYDIERRAQGIICKDIGARQEAMYVGLIASVLFGGTTGTSYNDVLRLAGLRDAAADAFDGWPQYSTEDLLAVNPPWIVVPEDQGQILCGLSALHNLQACAHNQHGIIEVPADILESPGSAIITAAAMVFDRVYGPCDYAPDL